MNVSAVYHLLWDSRDTIGIRDIYRTIVPRYLQSYIVVEQWYYLSGGMHYMVPGQGQSPCASVASILLGSTYSITCSIVESGGIVVA